MPTITASTITLMPELTTLPSTRSARKLVRFHSAKGTRMKPASVVSLNSMMVTNSCTARMKKRSEEHTSELQSLMRISYAVFCLKKKKNRYTYTKYSQNSKHNTDMHKLL